MKKFFEKEDVKFEEVMEHQVPLHKVVLSFNDDIQAEAFLDWWLREGGVESFAKWCEKNGENYD